MMVSLPFRNEVPSEEQWDITDLLISDEAFYTQLTETTKQAQQFRANFDTQITVDKIESMLQQYSQILIEVDRMANYVELRLSVDTTNEAAQNLSSKFSTTYGKIASNLAFVESTILALSDEELARVIDHSQYKHFLTKLKARKPYQLAPNVEEALASFSPIFEKPYELYGNTKMLDIAFDSFKHNDAVYPMDYVTFENDYEDNADPEFRQKSFATFSDALKKYQHTTATTYNMQVQQEKI